MGGRPREERRLFDNGPQRHTRVCCSLAPQRCAQHSRANIYVDSALPGGTDCPTGNYSTSARNCTGSAGQAYNTLQEGVNAAFAGDTVRMRAGTYSGRVTMPRSGTSNTARITIRNMEGEVPHINGNASVSALAMIEANHRSYITIQGLKLSNFSSRGIAFYGASQHIWILNNEVCCSPSMTGGGKQADAIIVHSALWPNVFTANDIIIDGNYVHDYMPGVSVSSLNQPITIALRVHRWRITNNILDNVAFLPIDSIGKTGQWWIDWVIYNTGSPPTLATPADSWPRYGYIAGNIVKNSGGVSSFGGDANIYIDGGQDIVIEHNVLTNNWGLGIAVSTEDFQHHPEQIITRFNTLNNNGVAVAPGLYGPNTTGTHFRMAQNTIYNNTAQRVNLLLGQGSDTIVKNNLFQNIAWVNGSGTMQMKHDASAAVAYLLNNNLWYQAAAPFQYKETTYTSWAAYKTGSGQDAQSVSAPPQFVSIPAGNFRLQSTSPARNAGGHLTTTVGGGTGTVITVGDSRWFSDGYAGVMPGDMIRVGADNVQITGINYATNQLTVTPSITWLTGEGVNYRFQGTMPDIGAWEFDEGEVIIDPDPDPVPLPSGLVCLDPHVFLAGATTSTATCSGTFGTVKGALAFGSLVVTGGETGAGEAFSAGAYDGTTQWATALSASDGSWHRVECASSDHWQNALVHDAHRDD